MPSLEPIPTRSLNLHSSRSLDRAGRQANRSLSLVEHRTLMRLAAVQSDGLVQAEKLREIDRLAQTAMSGQALLTKWRETLAGADPLLYDELKFFTDVARMGKGEIVMDTISSLRNK